MNDTVLASRSSRTIPFLSLIPGTAAVGIGVIIALSLTLSAPSRSTGNQPAETPDMPTLGSITGAAAPAATAQALAFSERLRMPLTARAHVAAFGFLEFDWNALDGVPGFDFWPSPQIPLADGGQNG